MTRPQDWQPIAYRFSMRDHMDTAAAMVALEGWEAYRWEVCEGGALVNGCVPSGVYTRGPNKGHPKFRQATPGTERRVVVADAHMADVATRYEATGKCWNCKGSGQAWNGWSRETGVRYCTCPRCNGTALPPPPSGAAPVEGES